MKGQLINAWEKVQSSYWFYPTIMTIGAMVMAIVSVYADHRIGDEWLAEISWLDINKPEGARALLSTVAGSMITVAGVAFSITIASVALASSQFGPRLLTNFMRDTGNQIVLGTFLATFVYCLMVLRTIHDGEDWYFVPQISVILALGFTFASVGILIYFIHHIAAFLHASNIIAAVGEDLQRELGNPFPSRIGNEPKSLKVAQLVPDNFDDSASILYSQESGYVQTIDHQGLLEEAKSFNLTIKLCQRPGNFVLPNDPLIAIWPPGPARDNPTLTNKFINKIILGNRRTPHQDMLFFVNELVEVATRALSTGINDPFTAMDCLDQLALATCLFTKRERPSAYRVDDQNQLRVIAQPISFAEFCDAAYGQLKPYVSADKNAAFHMLKVLIQTASKAPGESERDTLMIYARELISAALLELPTHHDREALKLRYKQLVYAVYRPTIKGRTP